MTRSLLMLCAVVSAIVSLTGCNDSQATVTGNVTVAGQPLPKGQIQFNPVDGGGTPVEGSIVAGKYTARMLPGEKTVLITETLEIYAPTSTEEMQRAAAEGKTLSPTPVSRIKPETKGNSTKVNVTKETKTLDFPLEP